MNMVYHTKQSFLMAQNRGNVTVGMYTSLRFIGTIKEEWRESFENIAEHGWWDDSSYPIFVEISKDQRMDFIPCGSLCCAPDDWYLADKFERSYSCTTGIWTFKCSLKNYDRTIEKFLEIIPELCESIEHCEYFYEEWDTSRLYNFVNGELVISREETMSIGDFI